MKRSAMCHCAANGFTARGNGAISAVGDQFGITADTALRLARFFNTSHQFWLNLQSNYDVQCAEDAAGRVIARIRPWQATIESSVQA